LKERIAKEIDGLDKDAIEIWDVKNQKESSG
jgi:hypothetical protein